MSRRPRANPLVLARRLLLAALAAAVAALGPGVGLAVADGGPSADAAAAVGSVPAFTAIAAGGLHACALTGDGSVWCWAYGAFGQLGNGGLAGAYEAPVQVVGLRPASAISAGGNSTCALVQDGGVSCWGENLRGQLGDGTTSGHAVAVPVVGLARKATSVSVGFDHACAVLDDGSATCWGANAFGQLGDRSTVDRLAPVTVTALPGSAGTITAISAGNLHTCARTADGSAWCWGANTSGQLGDGTTTGSATAVRVGAGGGAVRQIAAGDTWTCALRDDGTVLCWGANVVSTPAGTFRGALGTGSTADAVTTPAPVQGLPPGIVDIETHSWTQVRAAVLAPDGSVWTWGANDDSAVGPGAAPGVQTTPVRVLGDVAALTAGGTFTAVLLRTGEARWWGDGDPTIRLPWSGSGTQGAFRYRPPADLVPEITTAIPTPAQISTSPDVLGANLILAAIAMLAFTGASEILNRTVADLEPVVRRRLGPLVSLVGARARLEARSVSWLGGGRRGDVARVVAIAAFYGVVYALLDPSWNPVSVTGLWLVISFAIACGLVGISDDYASWTAARRFGVASDMAVRPGSVLTAIASTLATRVLVLVPGVMIGTPEALDVEEAGLDRSQRGRLAASGLGAVGVIGGGAWLLTLGTTPLGSAVPALAVAAGGLQAFLLLVFAVALQNAFVQLLAFRNSAGRALYHVSRVGWGIALLAVTFLFWHTLVNPRGDLASALGQTNVRAFLATVGVVLGLAIAGWAVTRVVTQRVPEVARDDDAGAGREPTLEPEPTAEPATGSRLGGDEAPLPPAPPSRPQRTRRGR